MSFSSGNPSSSDNVECNSSNPSYSVPRTVESSGNKPLKCKKKITIEYDGGVVGEYSKKWSSCTGDFVRAHIPISYKDLR